jgi:hypothetical protein
VASNRELSPAGLEESIFDVGRTKNFLELDRHEMDIGVESRERMKTKR